MIHQFEVYVDDTPHISAMSSNVITFECLRRLREFRQSLKLAAAGVRMYLLLAHLGRENCKLHLGLGSKEEICALVSDMRFCHPPTFFDFTCEKNNFLPRFKVELSGMSVF